MKKSVTVLCLILAITPVYSQSGSCGTCMRNAILEKLDLTDPAKMVNEEGFPNSVQTHLSELLTTPCFHFTGSILDQYTKAVRQDGLANALGEEARVPEYVFEVNLETGLDGYYDKTKAVTSVMTISMYFDGDQRELVHRWQTLGTLDQSDPITFTPHTELSARKQSKTKPENKEAVTGTDWSGLWNKTESSFKNGPGISEIIKHFEKRPSSCTITPDKEELSPGERIQIKITDLKDEDNEKSREFNRIVVHAVSGTIATGRKCEIGPDYRVFEVGDGTVVLDYVAPDSCVTVKDKITVYSACDVLPAGKVPFSETKLDKEIGQAEITSNCYDAVMTITKSVVKRKNTSAINENQNDKCTIRTENQQRLTDRIEATINVGFESVLSQDGGFILTQKYTIYKPVNVNISQFKVFYDNWHYDNLSASGAECDSHGSEKSITEKRTPTNSAIILAGTMLQVWYDSKTNKALKIGFLGPAINYDLQVNRTIERRSWPDGSDTSYTITDKIRDNTFGIDPVGEMVEDTTEVTTEEIMDGFKKLIGDTQLPFLPSFPKEEKSSKRPKIRSDELVTKIISSTEFGGEGQHSSEEKIPGGTRTEDLSFKWNIKLIKK